MTTGLHPLIFSMTLTHQEAATHGRYYVSFLSPKPLRPSIFGKLATLDAKKAAINFNDKKLFIRFYASDHI